MAKLQDKFFNRVIEGDLELGENENSQVVKAVEDTSALKVFENIVDKNGHKRFIEGDINLIENAVPTKLYGKWSLSGSHLLIVLAISVKNGDVIPTGRISEYLQLPEWVNDKIVTLYGVYIDRKSVNLYDDSITSQGITAGLVKDSGGIYVYLSSLTLTSDKTGRIAFDLLIDDEAPEQAGE